MKRIAEILLREFNTSKTVPTTGGDKPIIPQTLLDKWQRITNLFAPLVRVQCCLIKQLEPTQFTILLSSQNKENTFTAGAIESLLQGSYCETVIGRDSVLLISNALNVNAWKHNPDVKRDLISYCGQPIKWPDNEFFGTICLLDNKTNRFSETCVTVLQEFRRSIEKDLEFLIKEEKLKQLADHDTLSSIFNRRKIEQVLHAEFKRSQRYQTPLSIAIMDLDKFKQINDTHGHNTGDRIIVCFAEAMRGRVRETDHFGRWGGDEFLLICPHTDVSGIKKLMSRLPDEVQAEMRKIVPTAGFSFGVTEISGQDTGHNEMIKRADIQLYQHKRRQQSTL